MKTIILTKISRVILLITAIFLMNSGVAQALYASVHSPLKVHENESQLVQNTPSTAPEQAVQEMISQNRYWILYLETVIDSENTALNLMSQNTSILDEMEQNPVFWADYVQNSVKSERNFSDMESVSNYWTNFLRTIIASPETL
jgi:hypothetical protein